MHASQIKNCDLTTLKNNYLQKGNYSFKNKIKVKKCGLLQKVILRFFFFIN